MVQGFVGKKEDISLPGEEVTKRIMMSVVIAFSLMIVAAFTPAGATDCKEPCQAVVTEVKGTCYMHQDDKRKKKKLVVGDCLSADQELKCDKSAHVKFKFCINGKEKVVKVSYQIPKVAPLAIKDREGSGAGRPMGPGSKQQSPPSGVSEVQPSCQGQWLFFRP
jgi:hypothetical protein